MLAFLSSLSYFYKRIQRIHQYRTFPPGKEKKDDKCVCATVELQLKSSPPPPSPTSEKKVREGGEIFF